jgi:hypothetical protein
MKNKIENYKEYQFEYSQIGNKPSVLCKKITARAKWGYKIEFNYFFANEEKLNQYVLDFIKRVDLWEDRKQEEKNKKKEQLKKGLESDILKVGDIYYSSWGYEQTNIDFYQIIEVKGQYATFQEICSKDVEGSYYSHGMACMVVPIKDSFHGEPIKKKMKFSDNSASCSLSSFQYLSYYTHGSKGLYKSWYN